MYRFPVSVWISVALTLALSLFSLSKRYAVEQNNRAVSIVAEADQIELLAASQGVRYEDGVNQLTGRGLGGLVVTERTVGELETSGTIAFHSPMLWRGNDLNSQTFIIGPSSVLDQIRSTLQLRTGQKIRVDEGELIIPMNRGLVRNMSAGIDPDQILTGYEGDVIARLNNPPGTSESYVRGMIKHIAQHKARYFLPAGEQVLGRKGNMKALQEALAEHQIYYVSPEFAKIGGDETAIQQMPERTVRLHAAQAIELDKISAAGAIERYAKAAAERNIRFLLVRPVSLSSANPLEEFGGFIADLKAQLEKEGLTLKSPHPFEDAEVPRWVFPALGLAVMPMVAYLISLIGLRGNALLVIGLLLAALGVGCWLDTPRNYAALLASLVYPTVAIIGLRGPKAYALPLALGLCVGLSLVGGLAVAAMLNGLPYMIRADQFGGVKAAHFAPLGLVAVMILLLHSNWRAALSQAVTWVQVALGMALLVGLAFMASRTGNDNPAGVSGLELQFRSLLEQFLVVRPRTKEMLIGYPALVVGLGLWLGCLSGRFDKDRCVGWAALLLAVGMIGLTSLVNTLCHLHTPLQIGLLRIVVGLAIGGTLGSVLWLAVRGRFPDGRNLGH